MEFTVQWETGIEVPKGKLSRLCVRAGDAGYYWEASQGRSLKCQIISGALTVRVDR